jgi:WD40 repeat protein
MLCTFKQKLMRRTLSILFILSFISFPQFALSQVEKEYDKVTTSADSFFRIKQYDSALLYNLKAVKLIRDNKDNAYLLALSPVVMLNTGRSYNEVKDVTNAHRFMNYALQLARANKNSIDAGNAFIELNKLHRDITLNDLSFNYPAIGATEEVNMFFPVTKVEQISKDSLRITIRGGRLDGIVDSVKRGGILSRYDSTRPKRPLGLVNAHVRELHDNYIIAHSVNDSLLMVYPGDIVELKTRIPLSWRKLDVSQNIFHGITLNDNYRQPVYSSRYLYYFTDSLTNKEIAGILKYQVEEIVATLGEDTTGAFLDYKGKKGIFAGEYVMRALGRSTPEHIRLFLAFMNAFPRKYLGTSYKFAEMYATWVISSTPMADREVMPLLVNIKNGKERQEMVMRLEDDIKKNELVDRWFNDGMLMANADNIDSAFYMAELIHDASIALKDSAKQGWSVYLSAYTEKKLGNNKRADTLFRQASKLFKASRNREGEMWATNAIKNLTNSRAVAVALKTGHVFQYMMAPSPNSRYLATAGNYDKLVKIWDIKQGRTIASFTAHSNDINSIHYSPNGRYIVTSSDDKTIKIWNAYDFSLLTTINRPKAEVDVIFTPDSKQLVAGGYDSLIKFIDLNTGTVTKTFRKHRGTITSLAFSPANENYLFSSGNDSMVYKWNLEKNDWDHWYSAKGRIMRLDISNNGHYMSMVCSDTLIRVWKLETNKFYFNIRPHYTSSGSGADIAYPSFTPDSRFMALAFKSDTLDLIELSSLGIQAFGFKIKDRQGMLDMVFSPDGSYLATRMSLGGPLRIINFEGWDYYTNPTINIKELEQYANIPLAVQFSKDDKELAIVHQAVSKIDLRNGSTSQLYSGSFIFMNNYILMNDGKTGFYSDVYSSTLKFYDLINKKITLELSLPDKNEELRRFDLSADNKYIVLGGKNSSVAAFSLPSGKMLFSGKYQLDDESSVHFLRYDSLGKNLFVLVQNDTILVLDPLNGKIKNKILADRPQSVEVSPRFIYVTCDKSLVYKYDAKTFKLLKKINVHDSGLDCYGSVMSSDHRYLVVQVGEVFVTLDTRTDKVIYERYDHDYANGTMSISHNNKLLATGGFDSRVHIYHLATGKKISTIYTPRDKDFMLVDDEGHYLAPKSTLEAVNFSFNNNSYGFEQFDTRYNRPDIVLKKIGAADSSLLSSYRAAWKKRLKKLNISEKELGADIHLPVVRLKDKFAIKPASTQSEYELNIECYDAKYPLRSLQVIVNDNPLFGTAGKLIEGNTGKTNLSVRLPLSMGENMIKIYCTNSKGTSSLAEYIEIQGSYKRNEKRKTYFIGIAVSNYKDSSMNLRFAAKDVRDLATSFEKMYKQIDKTDTLIIDTLIDTQTTKEKILALRTKLMNTNVNDKVIISVNGHGLLSDSLDFYYATHDMDFKAPASRGLKYEELEALLDGIPARRKLLLIDACHSGALDKDELIAQQKKEQVIKKDVVNKTDTIKGFASRGTITKSNKSSVDANSTYELMQNLFADLSSGNGAVIISAAGGMEYAFESDTWNNGVFTYCVRKGLEEELADKDGGDSNKFVEVNELKNYVSRKVFELTNGKQRPVSRRENIEFNWVIW